MMNESAEVKGSTKQRLIEEFREARQEVFNALEGLKLDQLGKEAIDGWTIKDVLAHIIEWDMQSIADAKHILANQDITKDHWLNPDRFNEKAVEKYKDAHSPQVLNDLRQVTDQVLEFLESIEEQELFKKRPFKYEGEYLNASWILSYPEHDKEHAQKILEWRRQKGI